MLLTGMRLEEVLAMDMVSFNAFMPALIRVQSHDRVDTMRDTARAVNAGMSGNMKGLDEMAEKLIEAVEGKKPALTGKNMKSANDFLKDMGFGRKGGRI